MSSKYGMGTVYLRGKTFWIKFFHEGRPYYESAKTGDRATALRVLKKRQGEVATGKFRGLGPERVTMSQLLDLVCEDYETHERRSAYEMKKRLEAHVRPAFRSMLAIKLGTRNINQYVMIRQSEKAANATINRELAIIRRALSIGRETEPPLVLHDVKIPFLPEENVRQGFLEHAAYLRLRDELPAYLRPIFVVGYHCGCRLGELTSIRWSQVDFGAALIRLEGKQTKNKEPRTLPIYGDMREWLVISKDERDQYYPKCQWVFHEDGRCVLSFRKAWASACKRAGVPGLLFHDLRRSAVRNMERAGISRSVAMKISGHKTEAVYRRYDIVSERDVREAGFRLEEFLREQPKQQPRAENQRVQ